MTPWVIVDAEFLAWLRDNGIDMASLSEPQAVNLYEDFLDEVEGEEYEFFDW